MFLIAFAVSLILWAHDGQQPKAQGERNWIEHIAPHPHIPQPPPPPPKDTPGTHQGSNMS